MRANRTRTRDGSRPSGSALIAIAALSIAGLYTTAASAADVVDVRIGRHPEYTRVVFELNAPAGYRIERRENVEGRPELVVSLSATTSERTVRSRHPLIESIELTPRGNDAVAHVALSEENLRLKEMILANPPRIVLDLIPSTPPAVAQSTTRSQPEATVVAVAPTPEPAPAIEPQVEIEAQVEIETDVEIEVAQAPGDPPMPSGLEADEAPSGWAVTDETELEAAIVDAHLANQAADEREPSGFAVEEPERGPELAAQNRAPTPERAVARMPAVVTPPAQEEAPLFDMQTAGYAVGGIALVGLAAAVVIRRRRSGEVMDASEFDQSPLDDESPFTGLERGMEEATEPAEKPDGPEFDFGDGASVPSATGEIPSPIETSDEPVLKGTQMEATSDGATDNQFAAAAPPIIEGLATDHAATQVQPQGAGAPAGGLDEDGMRLVRELERRLASVENRLDEVVDARERLERQVAAQTEELRVQRAAIARTQRAVRNLSRPEEDAPTEPALRNPEQPTNGPNA